MSARRATLALLAVLGGLCGSGCRTWPGHLTGRAAPSSYQPLAEVPQPGLIDGDAQIDHLTEGRALFRRALKRLETLPLPGAPVPRFIPLPRLERALREQYARGTPLGPVRSVVALGVIAWAPSPPARVAGLWVNPAVLVRVLAARQVVPRGPVHRWPRSARRTLWIEKPGVGAGPLRVDLRFALGLERVDPGDGVIWVRSDSDPAMPGEHVTLWRGLFRATPISGGAGTRITEVIAIGTDLLAPPFLKEALREQGLKTLRDSRLNLLKRAGR